MTLSTSEIRSRNWVCPEVTSSPTKVLGEDRGGDHTGMRRSLRTETILEGAEDATEESQEGGGSGP